ncbi:NUDIX hydrolase [Streptomyces sp. NPDC046182]|uniref:NUDIX hydrolase n=1 Tax=Streptomyces sp. NPDC046182 TaxID=3154601 RepID=UPI0033F275E9
MDAYLAEGNARQARKRVAADVLLKDASVHVLLVNPTYKPGWDLPGGMAEANEPPEDAVTRELVEELGLKVTVRGLLVVDWVAPHGPWDDQIAFIFNGGILAPDQAARLTPQDDELAEAVLPPTRHRPRTARRPHPAPVHSSSTRPRGRAHPLPPKRPMHPIAAASAAQDEVDRGNARLYSGNDRGDGEVAWYTPVRQVYRVQRVRRVQQVQTSGWTCMNARLRGGEHSLWNDKRLT